MLSSAWRYLALLFLAEQSVQNPHGSMSDETRVAVYRGPAACDGCPESAADLVESALEDVKITYVGPDEDVDISKSSLKDFDVYIQPGGGDLDPGWKDMKKYADAIREFVSGGGYFVGICLGAYLAGDDPGFGILPDGVEADEESAQDDAEVKGEEDTVVRVNWTFSSGKKKGKTEDNRWLYFQDGASIMGEEKVLKKEGKVLGRYSKSGDVAAYVASHGKGVVGVVGPHPEATKDWYDDEHIKNPGGYDLDIGRDFIRAVMGYKDCE